MAIMQSCCCWRSVRRGSFACAVYSMFYFAGIVVSLAIVLQEEIQYLAGNRLLPKSKSVLEQEVSPVTMRFNIALLVCSSCGVISCLLLLFGLFKDEKMFLLPWICTVIICGFVDITHLIYLLATHSLVFTPTTALLLTFDFFFLCLNLYSVLCVISQYQEYAAGRGTASHDHEERSTAVRYTVQPTTTATSCLSSRRAPTNNETRMTATPTQSPTTNPNHLTVTERSPTGNERAGRKHVQFPDTVSLNTDKTDEAVSVEIKQPTGPQTEELIVPVDRQWEKDSLIEMKHLSNGQL